MTEMITVPIETDPNTLAQDAFDYLELKSPLWTPSDGQLDTWLIESIARIAATINDTASDVPLSIFRYFGNKVIGLPPVDASTAVATTTWALSDSLGHTIPAGTTIGVPDTFGNYLGFATDADVVVATGSSTASSVAVTALDPGTDSTALGTAGTVCTLIDQLAWVTGVTLAGATSGGSDAETDEAYLNRLTADLRLMSPRPILPGDFTALAKTISGVGRAAYYDGYDAVALTSGNDRTITIAVADVTGLTVGSGTKTAVYNYLQSLREVNFLVYVVDPNYSTVDVTYSCVVYSGYDPVEVKTRTDAALQNFLSPATWGIRTDGDLSTWDRKTTVKLNDLIVTLGKVDGVDDVTAVTQRISPAGYAAADVTLTGVFPLPLAGTMTGTVT